jgi:RNA polymerase sigma-70 factor, ECF subfamily
MTKLLGTTLDHQANALADTDLVRRILAGEKDLYEVIIRRYNQRLYRIARSIVQDEEEAEDVVQDTYTRAFEHLAQFEGRALFSTWLTRIAVHASLHRMRLRSRLKVIDSAFSRESRSTQMTQTPEHMQLKEETRAILENAIDHLPQAYRSVLIMRLLEAMTTSETAQCLDISEETVKIRLVRARRILRRTLFARVDAASVEAFQFLGERCDRITANVLQRIEILLQPGGDERSGSAGGTSLSSD